MVTKTLLMRKKTLLFFEVIVLSIFINTLYAQPAINTTARNTIYADFASKGALYSLNYDRVFSHGATFTKSYRAGFCILNNAVALPLGINFFTGQNTGHLELSITLVPYIEKYQSLFKSGNLADKKMYIIPGIGYRYQKPEGGFFFKVAVAPLIYLDPPSDNFWKMDGKVYPGLNAGAGFSF
ncbi:MAG: hypothetical protein RIR31_856 [Bacteroidota bacterium]